MNSRRKFDDVGYSVEKPTDVMNRRSISKDRFDDDEQSADVMNNRYRPINMRYNNTKPNTVTYHSRRFDDAAPPANVMNRQDIYIHR